MAPVLSNAADDETQGQQLRVDGLPALVAFVRRASGADIAILFEARSDHLAMPLLTNPELDLQAFPLSGLRLQSIDWSNGPVATRDLRLPASLVAAVGSNLAEILFIATPVPSGTDSGILLLWHALEPTGEMTRAAISAQVRALAPAFSQMMSDRRTLLLRRLSTERFHDLFGSVPISIVVLEGDGRTGLVNEAAAALLGLKAGELQAAEIGGPMRALRMSCRNAETLSRVYAPLQANVDYAIKTLWDLGEKKLEVDTHPILGNGRNGRIWLFHDVTAQHAVQDKLRRLSITDPLTGLSNRRHFTELGHLAFEQTADCTTLPLAVLMIDIDHFKAVNDSYGHLVGDEVLRAVSGRLGEAVRERDLLARLGGEEFAVLIKGMAPEKVQETAERLRLTVAETAVRTSVASIEIRISIGVAVNDPRDANLAALLTRADRALYEAKRSGRNRVVIDSLHH